MSHRRKGETTMIDREAVAALCHEQWSAWIKHIFSKCRAVDDGSSSIPPWAASRWMARAATSYADLGEAEKEFNLREADGFIALFADRKPDVYPGSKDTILRDRDEELVQLIEGQGRLRKKLVEVRGMLDAREKEKAKVKSLEEERMIQFERAEELGVELSDARRDLENLGETLKSVRAGSVRLREELEAHMTIECAKKGDCAAIGAIADSADSVVWFNIRVFEVQAQVWIKAAHGASTDADSILFFAKASECQREARRLSAGVSGAAG